MKQETKNQTPDDSEFLRGQAQFAKHYHVSKRTASDWQARRIVPFMKIGRKCVLFRKRDVDAALAKFTVAAI